MGEQEKKNVLPPGFLPYQRMLESGTPGRELPPFDPAWLTQEPARQVPASAVFGGGLPVFRYAAFAAGIAAAVGLVTVFVFNKTAMLALLQNKGQAEAVQKSGMLRAAIVFVQGQPQMERDGQKAGIALGQMLVEGDRVRTGPGGRVDLGLPGGHMIRVKEGSEIDITTLRYAAKSGRDSVIGLTTGEIVASVKKLDVKENLQIKAPTAIAGVRGTGFRVTTDGTRSVVSVAEGHVEVRTEQGEAKVFEAGQAVTATKGETKVDVVPIAGLQGELSDMEATRAGVDDEVLKAAEQLAVVKSDADIARVYNRDPETIRLKNGTTYRGVVASQVGSKLLVQTNQSTFIVDKSEILEIVNEK